MSKDEYRAWDKTTEKFIYDGVTDEGTNVFLITNHGVFWKPGQTDKNKWQRFKREEYNIEKLKGRDSKGRKLYENDIIEIVYPENDIGDQIKVIDEGLIQGYFAMNKVNKIGNIHEDDLNKIIDNRR